jgi:predicted AlkP superfamily phosphohydrolase/phosphomutase/tetratricopeptide (TPR) repeat protein
MDSSTGSDSNSKPQTGKPRRILLVGWDAADWRVIDPLIEAGQMPTLAKLIDGGSMGNLATLHPVVSPMLWNSIVTGKTADKHGILGFTERDPVAGIRPVSSVSRRTKAIWNIFQQALGWRCNVINWWASHPAEPLKGTVVSNYFPRTRRLGTDQWQVPPHAVHPPERSAEFGPLRMQPDEVTDQLILPFIPRAAEIDQENNKSLEVFARLISECCTVQAVTTAAMEAGDWDFTAVYFDSIDHFSHAFMYFHPPRMQHIVEEEFELFKDVVAGIYRFQDMMLERLVDLAGPEALIVVCSDHGFQSGALRPKVTPREPAGPVIWHRDYGILVLHGPGVKADERFYGATLLDITPTLLTLCGLPVGADMDGKPLLEIMAEPGAPEKIPSWDAVPGDDGRHPPSFQWETSPEASEELMKQFAALGYIDDPAADKEGRGEKVEMENQYNLSQVYLSTSRPEEAMAIMEDVVLNKPWESRYLHQLANSYLKAGYFRAAHDLLEAAYPDAKEPGTSVLVWLMKAKARFGCSLLEEARSALDTAMPGMLRHPIPWVEAGWLWFEMKDLDKAQKCFDFARQHDPENASAWHGLASVYLRLRNNAAAIDAALEATQLQFHLPLAHFVLGVALARERRFDQAMIAFRRVIGMQPHMIRAHRWLAALHAVAEKDSFLAGVHRNQARQQSRETGGERAARRARATKMRPIPEIPSVAERRKREWKERPPRSQKDETSKSGKNFVIVSGLPRSGTSLMMQMLAAGGLPPRTDDLRTADIDNPEGYFEWEAVKRIEKEPQLLDEPGLEKKAIKVISALLPKLPKTHNYRIIYMRRPPKEIVASQAKMIAHRGTKGLEAGPEDVAVTLRAHSANILKFVHNQPATFQVLEIDFPNLVNNPTEGAKRVAEFLGPDILPHPEKLISVIRADLHRNKEKS